MMILAYIAPLFVPLRMSLSDTNYIQIMAKYTGGAGCRFFVRFFAIVLIFAANNTEYFVGICREARSFVE
ncbi:MAG: hypothetical protein IJB67_06225 [Firmicutes bacterium]|nr:hypothetical protein [Bacillota bacterium]